MSVKWAVVHNEIETPLEVLCSSKLNFQFLEMNFQNERTVSVYGKMTKIAQQYQISRTFLYRLLLMATVQLETLFSDAKRLVQNDQRDFAHLLFLLRLEGHCSLLSMAAILQALD